MSAIVPLATPLRLGSGVTAIGDQVRVLDGLVRNRFGDNAELMSAWRSARTIVNPVRSSGREGDGIEPPQPGGGIAPAA
jgi:hypothetical protein